MSTASSTLKRCCSSVERLLAALAGDARPKQRVALLVGPAPRDGRDIRSGRLRQVVPEIAGRRVGQLLSFEVRGESAPERVGSDVRLDHRQHRAALGVGDAVEHVEHRGFVDRPGPYRARRRTGVAAHHPLAREHAVERDLPVRVEPRRGLARHPRRERFVEPDLVPGRRRHQVAEPLVRDFVRDHLEDILLGLDRALRGIVEQDGLAVGDEAPVLHRAVADAGDGDLVELGQRVGDAEVLAEERQHLLGDVHRVARVRLLALGRQDAQRNAVHAVFERVELPDRDRHEIGRHRRRRRKLPARRRALHVARLDRHVGDDFVSRRRGDRDREARAERRLVESRKDRARGDGFQLRREHPRGLALGRIGDAEQSLARRVHDRRCTRSAACTRPARWSGRPRCATGASSCRRSPSSAARRPARSARCLPRSIRTR